MNLVSGLAATLALGVGATLALGVGATLALGVGATLVMDAWSLLLARAGVKSLSFCLVGRWLKLMSKGQFRHAAIAQVAVQPGECALGWLAHYLIGIAFAGILLSIMGLGWLATPSLWPCLLVAWVTLAMPFLIMQPSFGMGIAAAKTPSPAKARFKSALTHTVFGLGLYLSAKLWALLI